MIRKRLRIGLFGYGCVGQGLHDVLESSGFDAEIVRICVKDREKPRRLPMEIFTFDRDDILNDHTINLVVELTSDPDEAYRIVTTAMRKGKDVVTAGKTMVAAHLPELIDLQERYGVSLLYEASACASIPVIRNLEEYYDNELLHSVEGIFNGSTNYILTRMQAGKMSYAAALDEARANGFAEADPRLDVEGWDSKYKLCIITGHAYGIFPAPDEVFHLGIDKISEFDIRYAREKGLRIKLVAHAGKSGIDAVTGYVMPRFVSPEESLFIVNDEYNAVIAEAAFADRQFFYGKGAGGHATGCAVLSDISACSYGYRYEYKKRNRGVVTRFDRDVRMEIYLRFNREEDRHLFGFEEVTEYFCGTDYKYVKGVVNLERLYSNRELISRADVFVINTGRRVGKAASYSGSLLTGNPEKERVEETTYRTA
jgi:homoserine dehydrogenase